MNAETIRDVLSKKFLPHFIEVVDESAQHQGHAEAMKSGGGHYRLILVSDYFEGKSLLERHRAVYDTLETDKSDSLHALAIRACTVKEWSDKHPPTN
ncbi:MAG: BolA family transcriptional regulator [Candidatus Omnitrophota bacterium]|nr:BolA family transcriptional regulator [Candidatus Omnitrophota bacterium]